jgi:chemotaxis response regulator CheB
MRIAIVNDLSLAVEVLRRLVRSVPEYEVAWTAADGIEAVEKCGRDCPDLILMDLIMPLMDGAQATRIIMKQSPCAILVVTATVSGNADKVFAALSGGALDAVATPVFGTGGGIEGGEELLRKIGVMGKLIAHAGRPSPAALPTRPGSSRDARHDWWRWAPQREVPTRWASFCVACRRTWGQRWSWCSISTCSLLPGWWTGWVTRRGSPSRSSGRI